MCDLNASVVIWTTTPWTIPANRAISYSSKISYGLYEVTKAPEGNWAKKGEKYVLADKLAAETLAKAKVEAFVRLHDVDCSKIISTNHPLRGLGGGYEFEVPLLDGEHVTDDTGTGFVHTAPGHGLDDFGIWMDSGRMLAERGIDTAIPFTSSTMPASTPPPPPASRAPASSTTTARRATPTTASSRRWPSAMPWWRAAG